MLHLDPRFSSAVTDAVAALERRTDAEVVVVATGRSGSYADVPLIGALVAGFGALAFLAWAPISFAGALFPVYTAVAAGAGAFLTPRVPALVRLLAGQRRMRAQVREAAEAAFVQESVHGTRRRTGVLVYISALEQRVELLPDHGLLGRIAGAKFAALSLRANTVDDVLLGLGQLGDLLAEHVPAIEGENPNEVADAPRVRT